MKNTVLYKILLVLALCQSYVYPIIEVRKDEQENLIVIDTNEYEADVDDALMCLFTIFFVFVAWMIFITDKGTVNENNWVH